MFQIYSDAGVRKNNAAIACIVRSPQKKNRKLFALIDSTETIEAEAIAGIVGLLVLDAILVGNQAVVAEWFSDCLTLLNQKPEASATESFRSLLQQQQKALFPRISLTYTFVKGHNGHKENELCDKACTWACVSGDKLLRKFGEAAVGRLKTLDPTQAWHLVDLRGKTQSFEQLQQAVKTVSQKWSNSSWARQECDYNSNDNLLGIDHEN